MASPCLLLSYFEPFGSIPSNSSQMVVEAILRKFKEQSVCPLILETVELPVSYERSWKVMEQKLVAKKYDAVLAFGQAQGRKKISWERVALNWSESDARDNDNVQYLGRSLLQNASAALFSNLPLQKLVQDSNLQISKADPSGTKLDSEVSLSAGGYVCNSLYFQLLNFCLPRKIQAAFVHIPLLNEQLLSLPGEFSVSQEQVIQSLTPALLRIFKETHREHENAYT